MSKPTLYYDERSPPARAVLMLIDMLKIDVEFKFIDLFKGDQYKADYMQLNPSHAVPTVMHNDLLLTDSHTILIYFAAQHQQSEDLWPKESHLQLLILNKLFFNCFYVFSKDSALMSDIAVKGFRNIDVAHHERKIFQAYDAMNAFLGQHSYIAGEKLTVADIAILTTVSTADMIFPITASKWPQLHKWYQQLKALPEYHINAKGLAKLKQTLIALDKLD